MEPQPSEEKHTRELSVLEEGSANQHEETRITNAQDTLEGLPKEKPASKAEDAAEVGTAEPEPPFSIFSRKEKTFIVVLASLAALFSPLSANIYYPALTVLAKDLNVSNTLINLTITSYLVRPYLILYQ